MQKKNLKRIKVSRDTSVKGLAQSILNALDEYERVELKAIGASAVNQAVKGSASASATACRNGKCITAQLGFDNVVIDGITKSAIVVELLQTAKQA